MGLWGVIRRHLRDLLRRRSVEADVERELAFHLSMRARDEQRAGRSAAEARAEAERRMGRMSAIREACYEARGIGLVDHLKRDLRLAVRMLRARPGMAAVAILSMALAISGAITVFALVRGLVVAPVPYPDRDKLATAWVRFDSRGQEGLWLSPADAQDFEALHSMEAAALTDTVFNVARPGDPAAGQRATALAASARFGPMLGAPMAAGRWFLASEDVRGGPAVTVLSETLARRLFGAAPAAVGGIVLLDGSSSEVVGVFKDDYALPPLSSVMPGHAGVYVPFRQHVAESAFLDRSLHFVHLLTRRRPGVTPEAAEAEVAALAARNLREHAFYRDKGLAYDLVPLVSQVSRTTRTPLLLLSAAIALVLVLACTNLGHLMTAWGRAREAEFTVRRALGAPRARVVLQVLTESLLMTGTAALIGVLLAIATVAALRRAAPVALGPLDHVRVDWSLAALAVALAVATGLAAGLFPALTATRIEALRAARTSTSGRRARLVRRTLVVAQTAMAAALLMLTGLVVKSFSQLMDVDPGFSAHGVAAVPVSLPREGYPNAAARAQAWREIAKAIEGEPGVAASGLVSVLPLSGGVNRGRFSAPGTDVPTPAGLTAADHRAVSPGYFTAMGIPLHSGRLPRLSDDTSTAPVGLVDVELARALWGTDRVVGRHLRWGRMERPIEIIGVVGPVRGAMLSAPPFPAVYRPVSQFTQTSMWIVVRATDEALSVAAIRRAVARVDPGLPTSGIRSMTSIVDASGSRHRFASLALAALALLAAALASAGVYSVFAHQVAERRRELVIRLAIGAHARGLVLRLFGESLSLTVVGLTLGLAAGLAGAHLVAALLFGVAPLDWQVLAGGAMAVIALSSVAAVVPAWRIIALDPVAALKSE